MRTKEELAFRVRQELANVWLLCSQPKPPREAPATPLEGWPSPEAARKAFRNGLGSETAELILAEAEGACDHRFSLLGLHRDAGPKINWRRDWLRNTETALSYFRRIPYLDRNQAGDHKLIWELNRHQHLPLLAQAWLIRGDRKYLDAIWRDWSDWVEENPFQRGINWTSALEVAFRVLSWLWVYHWVGGAWSEAKRARFWLEIYRHGLHLEFNLSRYFSPNTHLIGEAVALHALGQAGGIDRWRRTGREVVLEAMKQQVRADGSHLEQSSYYHLYSLDFFLFHHLREAAPPDYVEKLRRMTEFEMALEGPSERLPFLGDDDGGRVFFPYGQREKFGRATRITAARVLGLEESSLQQAAAEQAWWWLGNTDRANVKEKTTPQEEGVWRFFDPGGLAVIQRQNLQVIFDIGGFGPGGAGHSHADTLNLIVRRGNEDILIDPGTYTYVGDEEAREWFRSTAAHNTVVVDGRNQGQSSGPFRWKTKPVAELLGHGHLAGNAWVQGRCKLGFDGGRAVSHERLVLYDSEGDWLVIWDRAEAEESIEQFWHLGSERAALRMHFASGQTNQIETWRSRVYGQRESNHTIRSINRARGQLHLEAVIDLAGEPRNLEQRLEASPDGSKLWLCAQGRDWIWERPVLKRKV